MASAPPSTHTTAESRAERLAEMVVGLTGCEEVGALDAVRRHQDQPDPLAIVAQAMRAVDTPGRERSPDRFKIAGILRTGATDHDMRIETDRRAGTEAATDDVTFDLRLRKARIRIDLTVND